ncbi:Mis12 protein-domain-containing protein [Hypoxylon sp. FL1284]|nr:Mis12 protein-domain-containing protein [Hypoxylon sp. FL1284]KAI0180047.1 Mis12 protein-domain-containing protein [Hypoxylon sp. FL1284]
MTTTTSDTELLTEHFGYPPVSLIDDIINSVNILAERALNSVEQGLLNAPPATLGFKPPKASRRGGGGGDGDVAPADLARMEVESGTHQLETLLCASIDRNFDKFEIYVLRNILCVRPVDVRHWMRLSHYEGLDFSAAAAANANGADSTNAPSLESINHLRRKLRESMRLNALLTAERARNDRMLDELRGIVGAPSSLSDSHVKTEKTASSSSPNPENQSSEQQQQQKKESPFAFLHDKGSLTAGGSESPLSTTTAFTLSQMQALRALSSSLRTLAPDLGDPSPSSSSSAAAADPSSMDVDNSDDKHKKKKTWRRERLEYVEGATRRYLETVEGLELGARGDVRDGEWQGAGRGLAPGELGAAEKSFAMLGRGAPGESAASGGGGAGGTGAADDDRMDES